MVTEREKRMCQIAPTYAAEKIRAIESENARLKEENENYASNLHTCHADCTKSGCVNRKLQEGFRKDREVYLKEITSLRTQLSAVEARLKIAVEVVLGQDRLRGYPTGLEWIELVKKAEALKGE